MYTLHGLLQRRPCKSSSAARLHGLHRLLLLRRWLSMWRQRKPEPGWAKRKCRCWPLVWPGQWANNEWWLRLTARLLRGRPLLLLRLRLLLLWQGLLWREGWRPQGSWPSNHRWAGGLLQSAAVGRAGRGAC